MDTNPNDSRSDQVLMAQERTILAQERTLLANERTNLANQRTFLAWLRTGLACVGGGLATARFLVFHTFTHQIIAQFASGVLILLGIVIFALSLMDYKITFKDLGSKNGYIGALSSVISISIVLIVISILFFLITFQII